MFLLFRSPLPRVPEVYCSPKLRFTNGTELKTVKAKFAQDAKKGRPRHQYLNVFA